MYVDKKQITKGITRFIEDAVIPEVSDKGFQIILNIGVTAIKSNNALLDKLFDHDIFKAVSKYDPKTGYDIDLVCSILEQSIEKTGYFPVKIPSISFISPTEKELKFSAKDVEKLKDYIVG